MIRRRDTPFCCTGAKQGWAGIHFLLHPSLLWVLNLLGPPSLQEESKGCSGVPNNQTGYALFWHLRVQRSWPEHNLLLISQLLLRTPSQIHNCIKMNQTGSYFTTAGPVIHALTCIIPCHSHTTESGIIVVINPIYK